MSTAVAAQLADRCEGARAGAPDELRREIAEQPRVVRALLERVPESIARAARAAREADVRALLIAARGSSDNAARYAQHVFGRLLQLPVTLATPSLTTLYGVTPRLQRTLVIGISQSGQSPDVRAVLERAREQRQLTAAITNDPASPLAAAAAHVIELAAGAERSVAATKSYTASLAALAALAVEMSDDATLRPQLETVAPAMSRQLERGTGSAVELLSGVARCAVAGRGPNYATAFEAALKLKELTRIAAEPFSPADLMHGPVAMLGEDTPLIAFAPDGPSAASTLEAVRDARRRGARCLLLSEHPAALAGDCDALELERVEEWLSPLVAILPAQALAAELALARGVELDAPFGLSKVTRTL